MEIKQVNNIEYHSKLSDFYIFCGRFTMCLAFILCTSVKANALDLATLTADFGSQALLANEALITQTGASNVALITQGSDGTGAGNYAEINQSGSNNQATINDISGSGNSVRIYQNASSDIAYVTLNGAVNAYVDITQNSNHQIAYVSQSSSGNKAVIKQ